MGICVGKEVRVQPSRIHPSHCSVEGSLIFKDSYFRKVCFETALHTSWPKHGASKSQG